MPLVNLIQEQRLAVKQRERKTRAFFLAFVAAVCGSLLGAGILFLQTEGLNSSEASLKQQLRKLDPVVKQIEQNDKELNALSPRLTTLTDAQEATQRWMRILEHLSRSMPRGMWLTNVRCVSTDPTKPVSLTLAGMCGTQDAVGDLLLRLQACADLESVSLRFTQEKLVNNDKGIEFEIATDIAGTAEKKAIKKEGA